MHGRVLRGGTGDLSLSLPCITRPLQLRTVTHRLVGPTSLSIHYAPLHVGHSPTRVFYF
jgi:hypothetical protein